MNAHVRRQRESGDRVVAKHVGNIGERVEAEEVHAEASLDRRQRGDQNDNEANGLDRETTIRRCFGFHRGLPSASNGSRRLSSVTSKPMAGMRLRTPQLRTPTTPAV